MTVNLEIIGSIATIDLPIHKEIPKMMNDDLQRSSILQI